MRDILSGLVLLQSSILSTVLSEEYLVSNGKLNVIFLYQALNKILTNNRNNDIHSHVRFSVLNGDIIRHTLGEICQLLSSWIAYSGIVLHGKLLYMPLERWKIRLDK